MRFKLIVAAVKKDLSEKVIDTAKEAGATGATIIPARGIGAAEKKTFFGLSIEGPTDVVLFVVEEHVSDDILSALTAKCQIQEPGAGIAFSVAIEEVAGIESQMKKFREQAREQYL
jgi:nitrogen regulatory protein P-II 1